MLFSMRNRPPLPLRRIKIHRMLLSVRVYFNHPALNPSGRLDDDVADRSQGQLAEKRHN